MVTFAARTVDALHLRWLRCVNGGGVLEHPAQSLAWSRFGLMVPPSNGAWVRGIFDDGWTCHIEQGQYGHAARKATWLYAFGVPDLPPLRWGRGESANALVSFCKNHVPETETRRRLSKKEARRTPDEFRDVLISIARSVATSTLPITITD